MNDQDPQENKVPEVTSSHAFAQAMKTRCLMAICIAVVAYSAFPELHREEPGRLSFFDLVFSFFITIATYVWFRFDAFQRAYRPSLLLKISIVLLLFVALLYYLFRSRPKEERLQAIINLLIFILMLFGLSLLGLFVGNLMDKVVEIM
ncbi:MAG: hypothetical protein ACLFUS_13580 [Candidatus Sumerlaeia bacterium]